ncbi:sugar ABC transporter ATP-binding protein, partial [Burkholderia multivorans]
EGLLLSQSVTANVSLGQLDRLARAGVVDTARETALADRLRGAKFEIYTLMGALAREGRALVVVSSDLRELMLICDRIGVMSAGRMTAVFERDHWTQDALLAAAFAGFGRDAAPHG